MTLILAAAGSSFSAMCCDTRVYVRDAPGLPLHLGPPSSKYTVKTEFVIGTYGCSPPGVRVHDEIGSLFGRENARAFGQLVLARFRQEEIIPAMGALLAGSQDGRSVVYRIEIDQNICHELLPSFGQAPQIAVGPGNASLPDGSQLDLCSTSDETMQRMLALQRAVAQNDPNVGAPFDCIIVEGGGVRTWQEAA
jgi:hypothetical protein